MGEKYSVVRFFFSDDMEPVIVDTGLTLEEAQEQCRDPESSSETAVSETGKSRTRLHGPWFHGYQVER